MSTIRAERGDVTTYDVDVVVNAANRSLLGGGGVDGAIHRAGGPDVLAACRDLRSTRLPEGLPTGDAVATTAGAMPARWVVHTVGPVWARTKDRSAELRSCYRRSLEVAAELGARTIAFPLVSAGVYGWPVDDAVDQAVTAIETSGTDLDVVLVAFSDEVLQAMRARLG